MYGYAGSVAKINLTTGEISDFPINDEDRILYIGGKSLAAIEAGGLLALFNAEGL